MSVERGALALIVHGFEEEKEKVGGMRECRGKTKCAVQAY